MYRKIYQILEETGKVKTAMILNGIHKGAKCMIRENQCISLNDSEVQEFWKDYEILGIEGILKKYVGNKKDVDGSILKQRLRFILHRILGK